MEKKNLYDVIIVGGGPAGLTAAIYLARAYYRVLVVEKDTFGGQITITSEVVNYPGIEKTDGKSLTENMRKQAQNFGAEFLLADVRELDLEQDRKTVHTSRGDFYCFGILLATGAHPRMIGFEGEEKFKGHGVAYCATCDGEFFTGKEIFVAGGGFAAAEESVFLTKYASHVTILIREPDFTCSKTVADKARNNEKITILTDTQIVKAEGDSALRKLVYKNTKTGEVTEYQPPEGDTFGIFVFAGYEPETSLLKDKVDLDEHGYVVTDRNQQTSKPGVYAAGDVCIKNLRQVVTAVGDGATAATELEKYASAMQKKTGIKPERPNSGIVGEKEHAQDLQTGSNQGTSAVKNAVESENGIFSADILSELDTVFARMERPLILKLYLNDKPVSNELKQYMEEIAKRTEKISVITAEDELESESVPDSERPFVKVLREDASWSGLAFHGVPGGHEFTSFILGLYNVSGPGQTIDTDSQEKIQQLPHPLDMKILVSLTCTMCPELVTAAQKIAAENEFVTAEVYDILHFPAYKEKYNVMSVPCLVVNDEKVAFGRKNLGELLEFLQ